MFPNYTTTLYHSYILVAWTGVEPVSRDCIEVCRFYDNLSLIAVYTRIELVPPDRQSGILTIGPIDLKSEAICVEALYRVLSIRRSK